MAMPLTPPLSQAHVDAAEDRLGALLNAAVDAIILITPRGDIARFNHAAERMFGYAATEVLGRNINILMPEPHRSGHDGYLQRYSKTGEQRIIGTGREMTAQRKDGTLFPIELSVGEFRHTPRFPAQRAGDIAEHGFVGILREISGRKQQEAELRRNETELRRMLDSLNSSLHEAAELRARLTHVGRLGTLGEMVSGIAHEVNQPLTAIANYANACRRLLASGQSQPGELAETLEKISAQAVRAGEVIRGLRNLVRKRDTVREPLDCNQLVRDVAKLVEFELKQAGFRLMLDLSPQLPAVRGDGVQIQQVVLNLIRNGFEAMLNRANGDYVKVETAGGTDDFVEIRISDCGPGISDETADRLFHPFFTTKPQGIGLGLSICQSIAQAHGGEILHKSREGGGTLFILRLPTLEDTVP